MFLSTGDKSQSEAVRTAFRAADVWLPFPTAESAHLFYFKHWPSGLLGWPPSIMLLFFSSPPSSSSCRPSPFSSNTDHVPQPSSPARSAPAGPHPARPSSFLSLRVLSPSFFFFSPPPPQPAAFTQTDMRNICSRRPSPLHFSARRHGA